MNRQLESLRLAVGLAHTVRGAQMQLAWRDGQTLVAGFHPAADVSLCSLRRAVMASVCPARPDCSKWIETIEIGGVLEPCGGGVYLADSEEGRQVWLSTVLRPEAVFEVFEDLQIDWVPEDALDATLHPDAGLGITTIHMTVSDPRLEPRLAEIGAVVNGACLVADLVYDAQRRTPTASNANDRRDEN